MAIKIQEERGESMNNAEREMKEKNELIEKHKNSTFEIKKESRSSLENYDIPNWELVQKICNLIKESGMNYRGANEALYHADKVLHELAIARSF